MSNNNYMGKIDKDNNPKGHNYFFEIPPIKKPNPYENRNCEKCRALQRIEGWDNCGQLCKCECHTKKKYHCSDCGYKETNRATWCDLGCGSYYNEMIEVK